jgi:hypothetical protein
MAKLRPNQFTLPSGVVITEIPLLFQREMVMANLKDLKNQTRRAKGLDLINEYPDRFEKIRLGIEPDGNLWLTGSAQLGSSVGFGGIKSPYGKPGDLLWVKENVKLAAWREDGRMAFDYQASPELTQTPWVRFSDDNTGEKFEALILKSTDYLLAKGVKSGDDGHFHWKPGQSPLPWKPSIHMPKAASRIWAMVEEIRVERVRDISEEDAKAEGILTKPYGSHPGFCTIDYTVKPYKSGFRPGFCADTGRQFRDSFRTLWISINERESWDSNPWVWVVKYRILSKTGRPTTDVIAATYDEVVNPKSQIVNPKPHA